MIASTYLTAEKKALPGKNVCLYDAARETNHFCHHPALGVFQGRLYAMWSNGRKGEDEIGQRVLYARSADGENWSAPRVLCEPFKGTRGPTTLTAAGFYAREEQLCAYVASYEYESLEPTFDKHGCSRLGSGCVRTALYALTSGDGESFSAPLNMNVPLCPNYGPRRLSSGRLLMTGNWAHAYTDDQSGLSGWTLRGFCPDALLPERPPRDDPSFFWKVSKAMGLSGALCEGAFVETADGVLHMLHRSYGPTLFESGSADGGEYWSLPEPATFPNGNSKFWLGRLPDGRYAYVGNPGPDSSRCPLVLSLSKDGLTFDMHYLIETEKTARKFPGIYKGGIYGYPDAAVFGGALYVVCSRWKEDILVRKIPLELV